MPEDKELGAGKTAFIISPIGDKLDARGTPGRAAWEEGVQMWEDVFQPACARFGLEAVRADKIAAPGEIPEQIFVLLRDAEVVIADLSGANPNVMYELGLRHSRDKITVQVGEQGRLPFDINTVRTMKFLRSERGLIDLRNAVEDALLAGLTGKGTPTTATRIWKDATPADPAVVAEAARESAAPDDPSEGSEEMPLIEMLAAGEAGLNDVAGILSDATVSIQEIGTLSSEASAKVKTSDAAGKGFAGRLLVTRQLATDLEPIVGKFEADIQSYYEALSAADAMTRYLIKRITEEPSERTPDTDAYLDSIESLVDAAEGSETNIAEYIRSASEWKRLSRDLAGPAKTIERAGNRLLEGITMIGKWRALVAQAREAIGGGPTA